MDDLSLARAPAGWRRWSPPRLVLAVSVIAAASCSLSRGGELPVDPGTGAGASSTGGNTGAGGTGSGADGGGGGVPTVCDEPSDCGSVTDCASPTCNNGQCGVNYEPAGEACNSGTQYCDGNGNCYDCIEAAHCAAGECADGKKLSGEKCDTNHQCVEITQAEPCDPYICNAAGDDCASSCSDHSGHSDCALSYYCDENDLCVDGFPLGHPCNNGNECLGNTHCEEDVCCDTACDDDCESCLANHTKGTDGTCAPVSRFSDPDDDCTGETPKLGCDGAGNCLQCGYEPPAPGGSCPNGCSDCDLGNKICNIVCESNDDPDCKGQTIQCPVGWNCAVDCLGKNSCENATIDCPTHFACEVDCNSGHKRCKNADILCPDHGPCRVNCDGGDNCELTEVFCGENSCMTNCNSDEDPTHHCGDACDCGCE